jgi:hypothetical protein
MQVSSSLSTVSERPKPAATITFSPSRTNQTPTDHRLTEDVYQHGGRYVTPEEIREVSNKNFYENWEDYAAIQRLIFQAQNPNVIPAGFW